MIFKRLFGSREWEAPARSLYESAVAQARRPDFYRDLGVPDTVDGRFELVALHGYLLLRRLRAMPNGAGLAQALFDVIFADMDASLREMGAGDLGVGKRVKVMAKGFYGRMAAYDAGLAGEAPLAEALRRNLYGTVEPAAAALVAMVKYLQDATQVLEKQAESTLLAGQAIFPDPPALAR